MVISPHHQCRQTARGGLEHVEEVEVVPPQRDPPVVDLEHAAHPELQPQGAEDQRIGAFGEYRRAVGRDAVDLHLEGGAAFHLAKQLHGSGATTNGGQADVFVDEVVGQRGVGGVVIRVLQRVQESFDRAGVRSGCPS